MSKIQASAKMKIPSGMLEELMRQVTEYIKQVKEKDSGTLQADWFISGDMTECEIRETYASSESALAHQDHLRELQKIIFKKFGLPYSIVTRHPWKMDKRKLGKQVALRAYHLRVAIRVPPTMVWFTILIKQKIISSLAGKIEDNIGKSP